jgi:hypothetical protein
VIWQAPPVGETYLQPIEVDPHGLRLIAEAYSTVTGVGVCSQTLLFRTDGTVVEVEVPAGFDGVVDVAFIGAEVLAVAYRATPDTFETALGLVSDAGTWVAVTIEGDLPEHHFVEACLVLPGTDTVALVLKVSGGDGDRDDDAIVLARLSGARLDVFTPPLFDDSLPGAQPLWDADGVVYPRLWNQVDGETAPVLVRAEWAAGQWVESEVLPSTALLLGPEMGEVVAQDASGTYWLRATDDQHGEVGNLLRLPYGARSPEPTGVDLSGITWFAWTEGER